MRKEKKPSVLKQLQYILSIKRYLDKMEKTLPPFTHKKGKALSEMVPMRDGVRLMTRVFLPKEGERWPAVVTRNPYVAGNQGGFFNMLFCYLTRYGIAVVCQECRGRGLSEGKWEPFVNERNDGIDCLDWVKGQQWCDGRIGLWGNSYTAFLWWAAADALPPEVKTMFLAVMGTEQYHLTYMNGMYRHELWSLWATQNTDEKLMERWDGLYQRLLRHRPLLEADEAVLGVKVPWYRETVRSVEPDSRLWSEGLWRNVRDMPSKVDVPVCMVGGWFDIGLHGMMTAFYGLNPETRAKSAFLCGPWTHTVTAAADFECPDHDIAGFIGLRSAAEWFNLQFHGRPCGIKTGVMKAYVVGEGSWKEFSHWPPAKGGIRLFLSAGENLPYQGGTLEKENPSGQGELSYLYDPENPVPTCGGAAFLPSLIPAPGHPATGSRLQPEAGYRGDVLSFFSQPFEDNTAIAGNIRVNLCVSSSAADTCFSAKIMEVFPDGKAYNICDGVTTLRFRDGKSVQPYTAGEKTDAVIEMWPVAWRIAKGSRLRVDISSSNYPAYHAHPNTAELWSETTTINTASQTVYTGGGNICYVELPLMD